MDTPPIDPLASEPAPEETETVSFFLVQRSSAGVAWFPVTNYPGGRWAGICFSMEEAQQLATAWRQHEGFLPGMVVMKLQLRIVTVKLGCEILKEDL